MDKSQKVYQNKIKGSNPDIDSAYWLKTNNLNLLKEPLVLIKGKAVLCKTPTDILII